MLQLIIRATLTAAIVVAAAEMAKRSVLMGAVIASLPLTSLLALTWLHLDSHDSTAVAAFSWSTLLMILPSLTLLAALPLGLRAGLPFIVAMPLAIGVTVLCYLLWVHLLGRFGVTL